MPETSDSANSSVEHQHGSANHVTIVIPSREDDWEPKPECCIYKVPIDLRNIKEEAYTPHIISIGPFHYGKKELMDMEKQKKRYIRIFSERKGKEKLVEMKSYIKSREQNIRNCYYEQPFYKSKSKSDWILRKLCNDHDKFVEMILYDVVFIIELFLRHHWEVVDFLLEKPRYKNTIKRDLQLLENQLPYFFLNKLYDLATKGFDTYKGSSYKDPPFLSVSCKFFRDDDFSGVCEPLSSKDVKHFTDLRRYFQMENHPTSKKQGKVEDLPCATKLDESGVRFRPIAEDGECLLNLKFKPGLVLVPFSKNELKIPRIKVNDWTEPLIRNVMALEQCHYPKDTHVCNYIAFMDSLINTEKDADLLIEKGIIVNCLGESKKVAEMFNDFCLHTSKSSSCYYDMAEDLKRHYKSRYYKAKATLKSVYFSNPWKGTGTVVGIIILLGTTVNTSFWLDTPSGKKCYMISPREFDIYAQSWFSILNSNTDFMHHLGIPDCRFFKELVTRVVGCPFEIGGKITTSLLSPTTTYIAYLVFTKNWIDNDPAEVTVGLAGSNNGQSRTVYIHQEQQDGDDGGFYQK
ncbi:hypothetical protein LWI29_009945 [Acer saccharum]|uniref:Uncharacterized protein n=1 Tax=Acer saccharum TaxID=4024 RepID=A0AA39RVM7_ACESA|nr:hypothetical protein LWI29_009945 [Acer saccharum]